MTVVRSGSATDVGRVRSVNEDRLLESVALFAVADGMGGHVGGEVAARLAIEVLQQSFAREPTAQGLVEAVRLANRAVWERSTSDPEVRGMGTTLTAAALVPTGTGDRLVVSNVGDSRAYRFASGQLVQMTHDHSVAEELVARGELSEAEAAVHPHRHILTRALGVAPDVAVDSWQLTPARGERFVLCSDGLTNEVSEERIAGVLAATPDPQAAADTLVRLANEHGGNDNVSVVVVDVVVADPGPPGAAGADGAERVAGDSDAPGHGSGSGPARTAGAPGPRGTAGHGTGAGLGASAAPSGRGGASATALLRAVPGEGAEGAAGRGAAGRGAASRDAASRDAASRDAAGRDAASRDAATDPVPGGTARTGTDGDPPAPRGGDRRPAGDTAGRPETLARHVAGTLSEVMGHRGRSTGAPRDRARTRRVTVRVVLFLVLVAAVAAGAWSLVRYYAEGGYYVGLTSGQVAVFQGRPGGFLGFEPHVVDVSALAGSDVLSYRLPQLRAGVQEPSRQAAERFVANLRAEACSVHPAAPVCARQGSVSPSGSASPSGSVSPSSRGTAPGGASSPVGASAAGPGTPSAGRSAA